MTDNRNLISSEYAERVLSYLSRKLPAYKQHLMIQEGKVVIHVPSETPFQPFYERVFQDITDCIGRIPNRERVIEFKVWSTCQERDFNIRM
jgi:hypothetical protein